MRNVLLKILFSAVITFASFFQAQCSAKWTIMIYLDGDNNLERYAIDDFLDLSSEDIGSTPEINILVQFDRINGYDTRFGDWTNTQRFYVTPGMQPDVPNAISDWGDGTGGREIDMGDWESLYDFVEWAKNNYPAEHYALILWDHGDGWRSMGYTASSIRQQLKQQPSYQKRCELEKTLKYLEKRIYAQRYQKSVCFDNTSFNELTLKEIAQALSSDCYVDIIAFDACLMGMIEVVYEVRNCASYLVASEESIKVSGFPYKDILSSLVSNVSCEPQQFADLIVQKYADSYGQYSSDTLSAVDLQYAESLFTALNNFCQSAINIDNQWLYLYAALSQTAHFDDEDYKDLAGFIKESLFNVSNQEIINKANDIIAIVEDMIVANFGLPAMNGLSIYFPEQTVDPNYNAENLSFADGLWPQFLHCFLSASLTKGFSRLMFENFDSGIPIKWTIVDGNNDRKTWTNTNPKHRSISNLSEPFMIVDSDWAGKIWMDEQLITETFILTPFDRYVLMFDHFFHCYSSESAEIDIRINNGSWQNILQYQNQDAAGKIIILLNRYMPDSETSYVQIRWRYKDAYDAFYWAIDNVYLLVEGIDKGDITRDGVIDIMDVIICLRISIGLEITIENNTYRVPYSQEITENADINNDGIVDISDVLLILKRAIGLNEKNLS
ncbi:MAG TPA: clostripain-related cysteine peptidase [bacterium]|nr:clostripain-related cysteine peptidase [bacterium]